MAQNSQTVNEIYTAYAAILAYQVENAYKDGIWNKEDLKKLVEEFKTRETFEDTSHHLPSNLEYVDSFYDPDLSTSGVALRDTNTDDIFIGFTGSNGEKWFKKQDGVWTPPDKDWCLANAIGTGLGSGVHLPPAYNFYEEMYDKYGERIILSDNVA